MDFRLNEDQEMFKKVAADFVKAEVPSHKMTVWYRDKETFQPDIYKKTAELGWLGMLIPEQFGGAGVSFTDCAVVFEELGRGPVPGPLFSCGVLGAQIIFEGGSEEQKKSWLPEICSGKLIAVPALTDKGAHFGPAAVECKLTKSGNDFILAGSKKFVFDARAATSYICTARMGNGHIALVLLERNSPGVSVSAIHPGFTVGVAEVKFENVKVPAANVISSGAGWQIIDKAMEKTVPILCAYQVGACQEIFEFTNEYTRQRVVFGQPIGRFQRVQDHCVDLSIALDQARWATYEALWKLDSGIPAKGSVHEAKAVASDGYYQSCNFAHMVWAGPGTDYGNPLMAHSVLAHALYQYLGTPAQHKRLMMDALYPRG